ncbi:MAG: CHAP domain-containing protein [Oscillospiraceae bacterium]|nr:CHAP domain-containing protein [Oscillospiraceae bacterium]MDD7292244.1 CHAP domain-containing protein [Clostridiaceae bacterium]MDY5991969.1 CHAP domain-containing protein [Oscillospiraceae bacterium]
MKHGFKRPAALLLAFLLAFCALPFTAFGEYENTYINTGDERRDIIGVAKTQLGNPDGTKYTAGRGNIAWCACFVVWCARQAGVTEDILKDNTWADAEDFGVRYFSKEVYTPQSGDLIFFDFEPKNPNTPMSAYGDHVGLVESVEGDTVNTVEGNAWSSRNRAYQVIEGSYPLSSPKIKGYGLVEYRTKIQSPVSYNAVFRVVNSAKAARAGAGEAFAQTRELLPGSTVSVVGYVYDENSMLWYKTAEGDYTVGTDLEKTDAAAFPPSAYIEATAQTLSAKTVCSHPNDSSDTLKKIKKNKTVEISGYVYNEYGNVWYRVKSGGYISCSNLSFENGKVPSNSITEVFTVRANEKILKNAPRLSAGRTRTLWRSATVNAVGFVYDREGSLWYLTDKGDYIYSSYLTAQGESARSEYEDRPFVCTGEKDAKSAPLSAAKTISAFKKGAKIRVCTKVENILGEVWYETTDGVFVSAEKLSCDHDYDGGVITKKATCTEKGVMTYTCKYCGKTKTKAIKPDPGNHSALTVENAVPVTCNKSGYSGDTYCSGCNKLVEKGTALPALEHCDDNRDMTCDNCGKAFSTPENCRCACHRFGLTKVVYKIVRVFWKIMKIHRVCICGEEHY